MTEVSRQGLAMLGAPEASIHEEYKDIPMRDGFQSSIKIHRPTEKPAGGSPLIVFCFGGGFISGDNDAGTGFARGWVRLFGAVVVNLVCGCGPK
jgi:acetyl esterase/lipase